MRVESASSLVPSPQMAQLQQQRMIVDTVQPLNTSPRPSLANQLADTQRQWWAAKSRGDTQAMAALHEQANQLRSQGAHQDAVTQARIAAEGQRTVAAAQSAPAPKVAAPAAVPAPQAPAPAAAKAVTYAVAPAHAMNLATPSPAASPVQRPAAPSVPVFAPVSNARSTSSNVHVSQAPTPSLSDRLAETQRQWWDAKAKGDTQAMDALHEQANQLRTQGAHQDAATQSKIAAAGQARVNAAQPAVKSTPATGSATAPAPAMSVVHVASTGVTVASHAAVTSTKSAPSNMAPASKAHGSATPTPQANKQANLNDALKQATAAYWDAKTRGDEQGMAQAHQAADALRKSGATMDAATAAQMRQQGEKTAGLAQAQRDWWQAKAEGNTAKMAAAHDQAEALRKQGAKVDASVSQDISGQGQVNAELADTKRAYWQARAAGDQQGMKDAHDRAQTLRFMGATNSAAVDQKINEQGQKDEALANTQRVYWLAKAAGDQQTMDAAHQAANDLRAAGAKVDGGLAQQISGQGQKSVALADAQKQYWVAAANGDEQGMQAAHAQAEGLRAQGATVDSRISAAINKAGQGLVAQAQAARAEEARQTEEARQAQEAAQAQGTHDLAIGRWASKQEKLDRESEASVNNGPTAAQVKHFEFKMGQLDQQLEKDAASSPKTGVQIMQERMAQMEKDIADTQATHDRLLAQAQQRAYAEHQQNLQALKSNPDYLANAVKEGRILPEDLKDVQNLPFGQLAKGQGELAHIGQLGLQDPAAGRDALISFMQQREQSGAYRLLRAAKEGSAAGITFGLQAPTVLPQTAGEQATFIGSSLAGGFVSGEMVGGVASGARAAGSAVVSSSSDALQNLMHGAGPALDTFATDETGAVRLPGGSTATNPITRAQLPQGGKIRFVPPEGWTPSQKLPRIGDGYVDRFGNTWVKGPSRTAGEPFEWDVQLGKGATPGMKALSIDGKHVNVSMGGHVTH